MANYRKSDEKPLFPRGPTLFARTLLLGLLSLALMGFDHRTNELTPLRSALSLLIYPVELLAATPVRIGNWLTDNAGSRKNLSEENALLRKQQLLLNAKLQKMAALEAENNRIRGLLESSKYVEERVLIAAIVSVDLDPYRHEVILNKGQVHQAYVGQPLIDAYGIIGQIVETTAVSSRAILITDSNHAIPVTVNRNGLRTVAKGSGKFDEIILPYLPNNADVAVGDLLITSGLGERFPAGYPVAVVSQIQSNPGKGFATITAKPTAHLDKTRQVLLVWRDDANQDEDQTEAEATANEKPVSIDKPGISTETAEHAIAKPKSEAAITDE